MKEANDKRYLIAEEKYREKEERNTEMAARILEGNLK